MKHRTPSRVSPPLLDAARRYGITITEDDVRADGRGGIALFSTRGLLKMFLIGTVSDRPPRHRARIERFQAHAGAVLDAEMVKARPREPGDVLYAVFGGEAIDQARARPETHPNDHFETALTLLGEVCDRLDAERGIPR